MKVKAEKPVYKLFTLKLPAWVCDELDKNGKGAGLSRQKMIEGILKQVLRDPKFVLKID